MSQHTGGEGNVLKLNRELSSHKVNGANQQLDIGPIDEPGSGGAHHRYIIVMPEQTRDGQQIRPFCPIFFQDGPIKESGVNGVTHEALLAILEDRLSSFQGGQFACHENEEALRHIRAAQRALHQRTLKRTQRGVEGTHAV